MKRSIISLCILLVIVLASATTEVIYSVMLAHDIDDIIHRCEATEDSEKLTELAEQLRDTFDRHEAMNEIFYSLGTIETFQDTISDLIIYSRCGDIKHCRIMLDRLKSRTKAMYSAGVF